MDLEGEAGVVCWRTDTGEEEGVEGPRNEASRPLIPIADEGGGWGNSPLSWLKEKRQRWMCRDLQARGNRYSR